MIINGVSGFDGQTKLISNFKIWGLNWYQKLF